ncbi:MAG: glycine dehydrogenase (aminomethyl-transferring) [Candidatus Omnitrophica bacterium CG1_02_46_14]|nr:MAG: glycine dehydrogenase (aminomethyl-transferring) [Candidatus Omnitrophica bacterium CG1_02_46_14]
MQYISNTKDDKKEMLKAIGVSSFDSLVANIPKTLKNPNIELPSGISELELDRELDEIGALNKNFKHYIPFIGGGNYDHFIPAVVDRLALRGEFITAYTPYQGEASQGTLQSVYEYQSLICELTGMDVSNASMYDGASSLAEAVRLALRASGRKKVLIPSNTHPEYLEVVKTYLSFIDAEIIEIPMKEGGIDEVFLEKSLNSEAAAVILQQPNFFGILENARRISELTHKAGALLIACVNPISLGIIEAPGVYGADIAVGEGQPLGNAVSFGGPHFGFFAVKETLLRKVPGRIVGMTVDKAGRRAFVLTLQAREQHIRREKATSNICSNQALCALKAAIYMVLLGKKGIRKVSLLNLKMAHMVYERLLKIKGVWPFSDKPFFNEFALKIDKDPAKLFTSLKKHKILGPLALEKFAPKLTRTYLFAVTEKRTKADLELLAKAIKEA